MMRLNLVFVGKTAFRDMESAIQRYTERLGHYIPTKVHLVRAEKIAEKSGEEVVKDREGERILKLVAKQDTLVLWDSSGTQYDSEALARFLGRLREEGASDLWMVVGGPVGTSKAVRDRADFILSLSRMTFPHDLARVIVVEQVYRAFTILKGEPYHR